jgi:hypothetical protein
MSTKRDKEMADGVRLWTHQKDDALHEVSVSLIQDMELTYEEVRWLRNKWDSLQSDGLTDDDAEIFDKLEELTYEWEEEMNSKHGHEGEEYEQYE